MNTIDFRLIRQLWMFLAVAEELHFGRAAHRLGMSQPPLTAQIKVLEQSLGITLFERSRRGTQLSAAGAAILPAVRKFADQADQLQRVVKEAAAGQTGVLQVGAITSAMLDTLPPLLEALRRAYPQLTVFVREIDSVEAVPALLSGELDLAFARFEQSAGEGITTLPLSEDRLAVALPFNHRLAEHDIVPFEALAGEPMAMSARHISPDYFDRLISLCRSNGFTPRVLYGVRSVVSQVAYVSCGQGIALVPSAMSKLAPPNVVIRPLALHVPIVTAAVAWNPKRHHPMIDATIELLKAQRQAKAAIAAQS